MPIVLLTAKADEELRVEMLRRGAQDYLMKPFSGEELKARIGNLIAMKRTRDVLRSELGAYAGDLERLARELSMKKRDLENALDSLRVARDQAERASAIKSDFLRLVSHELRTPLTVLRLHSDRLKLDTTLSQNQQQTAARISGSLLRLSDLVESLLEHTRIESGRLSLDIAEFDLRELVLDIIDEYQPQAQNKGLVLALRAPEGLPVLVSDRRLVRLIISNLVGNAIKFTARGFVEVAAQFERGTFQVEVSDSGPGIARELQPSIFEPFAQLEPLKHKHTPGMGLGLALVREMTLALGGQIELESEVSQGSTFTICLPATPRVAQAS